MNKSTRDVIGQRVRRGYLVALILLLIAYALNFYTSAKVIKESGWVSHTRHVTGNVQLLTSAINDAEAGINGFMITADTSFLIQHKTAPHFIDSIYENTRHLMSDNPDQQLLLDTLKHEIDVKYYLSQDMLDMLLSTSYKISDYSHIMLSGKKMMDSIRTLSNRLHENENQLLIGRSEEFKKTSHLIVIINITSLLLAIIIIFSSLIFFNRENTAKRHADIKAEDYRRELEMKVNELKKLNTEMTQLKSIEKFAMTGRISRFIAHEIRNPLTNINLAVDQLKNEEGNSDETNVLLDMVLRNSVRINSLITDLLQSTRSNILVFDKESIHKLLDESLKMAQDRIELKGIKVIKQYTEKDCFLSVDVQKIKIAFLNLIVNAIEAMEPEKGVLTLKTEHKNEHCVATISDNGQGIDSEGVSRLFEAYYTTKPAGTGLGLTNTQNIILSHKASIAVESEVGKGTTFTVTFNRDGEEEKALQEQ